ncbi:hypothetical protein [Hyphomonas sp.]|jgi:hypothetical protein|uniref:hypothetical protein n=1 Tax=Hyphomonas sp. TaxID=87 RepID=UPI0032D990EC
MPQFQFRDRKDAGQRFAEVLRATLASRWYLRFQCFDFLVDPGTDAVAWVE